MMYLVKQAKLWLNRQVTYGGYTVALYLESGRICPGCAWDNWADIVRDTLHHGHTGYRIVGMDAHWEGPDEHCDCGEAFTSEYGDPEIVLEST